MIIRSGIIIAYGLFLATLLFQQGYAKPDGLDRGLLFLSSTTYMLRGEATPVTQRGPAYPLLLAAIGFVMGVDEGPAEEVAHEFGSPVGFAIEKSLLQRPFLRAVLWVQILLFAATVVLVAATMKSLGLSAPFRIAALLMYLVLAGGAQIQYVHDLVLTQFLIAALAYFLVKTLQSTDLGTVPVLTAGLCAALSGLSRPTYQVLGLELAVFLILVGFVHRRTPLYLNRAVLVVIPTLILIGGWSIRNWNKHGFVGVSSVLGSTLSAKTALYVERASSSFPDLAPAFVTIRDQELVRSPEHTAALWGGGALNMLMRERGMSYVQANQFMARVNVDLIRRAPMRYAVSIVKGIVQHLWVSTPDLPSSIRLPLAAMELLIIALFLVSMISFCVIHTALRLRIVANSTFGKWNWSDSAIAALFGIFACSVLLTCAVEAGRAEHRIPVQFLMPLLLAASAYRLWMARLVQAEAPAVRAAVVDVRATPDDHPREQATSVSRRRILHPEPNGG